MAKVTLTAVHRIGLGKPKGTGEISYIQPGESFAVDEAEAKGLIASGAAKEVEAEEKPKPAPKKTTAKKAAPKKDDKKADEGGEGGDDTTEGGEGGEGGDTDGDDNDLM